MSNNFRTEQESFWAGEFGNDYITRNNDEKIIAANINLFTKVLRTTNGVNSIIEFGSNIGLNLLAIKNILPGIKLSAVEINKKAFEILKDIPGVEAYNETILNYVPKYCRIL
jgi:spore coat polysaccharide biosynthesis protein SpsF